MTVISTPTPPHRFSTEGVKQLLTLELPSLESLQGVDLDISTDMIRLVLPGSCEQLRIPLPLELVGLGAPTAKFSRKRRELTVTWDAALQASPQQKPASTQSAVVPQASVQEKCDSGGVAVSAPALVPERHSSGQVAELVKVNNDAVDCSEFIEDEVEDALKECAVVKLKSIAALRGAAVLPSDFNISGEASIKDGCCDFKAAVSFKWEMLDAIGGFLGAAGTVDVLELCPRQVAPKVVVTVAKGGSAQARAAGEWMKQYGSELISQCLNGEKLSASIFTAWDEAAWENEDQSADGALAPAVLNDDEISLWAKTWLEQKISNLTVKLFGGSASATFAAPQVSGEVSFSGKGSDAAPDFHLRLDSSWNIATSMGQTSGTLLVEFTPTQGSQGATVTVEAAPGKKASGQLLTALRQTGVSAVRGVLSQFMTELQQKARP